MFYSKLHDTMIQIITKRLMKTINNILILSIVLSGILYTPLQANIVIENTDTSPLNVRNGVGTSGTTVITTLATGKQLVGYETQQDANLQTWWHVYLPTDPYNTPPSSAWISWYMEPVSSDQIEINASVLKIRQFAGATASGTEVTIGGENALALQGQRYPVVSSTFTGGYTWYKIDLTENFSQNYGWVRGDFVILRPCSAPATSATSNVLPIPNANGTDHLMNQSWVNNGSQGYEVAYSTDGSNWNTSVSVGYQPDYLFVHTWHLGDQPNVPVYTRIRTYDCSPQQYSTWITGSNNPLYSACDDPIAPTVGNATSTSLDVTISAETPVSNPSYTTYSIFCSTTGQYVQANGTFGSEVFQTKANWGTVTVTGLSSGSYCFYAKARNMDGDVRFNASNNACGTTGTGCTPASVTFDPVGATIQTGQNHTFTVGTSGTAPISYQWQKNNVDISGATSSSYTVSNAATNDAGNYRCGVSNACSGGNIYSQSATLTVGSCISPTVTAQPQGASIGVGDNYSFSINATGTAPLTYQWQKDNIDIPGATSNTYSLTNAQTLDSGDYRCGVSNSCSGGAVYSQAATLTVTSTCIAPTITLQPQGTTISVGDNYTFTIAASGTAPLSYQWRKNGSNITNATSSSYTIVSAQLSDAGSYDCVVTNACNSATSNPAVLTVNSQTVTSLNVGGLTVYADNITPSGTFRTATGNVRIAQSTGGCSAVLRFSTDLTIDLGAQILSGIGLMYLDNINGDTVHLYSGSYFLSVSNTTLTGVLNSLFKAAGLSLGIDRMIVLCDGLRQEFLRLW